MITSQVPNILSEVKDKMKVVDYPAELRKQAGKVCEDILKRLPNGTLPDIITDYTSEPLSHAQAIVLLELVIRLREIITTKKVARKRLVGKKTR